MSATATLYLQPLSTASVTSSIASKASETLSRALVAWISQKKYFLEHATAYQTLSSLTSPTVCISTTLTALSALVATSTASWSSSAALGYSTLSQALWSASGTVSPQT